MKKAFLLLIGGLLLGMQSQAQISDYQQFMEKSKKSTVTRNVDTVAWIYDGSLNIGFNQGILHNWAAGGELASMTISGLFNGNLTRYKHRKVWANNLNAAYGLFYAYSNSFIPRKTDDRIDLTSRYGYQLKDSSKFFITALLNAQTQFTKAYDYEAPNWRDFSTSDFLSPLYVTLAPGIEYRDGSQFSVFYSPVALRGTFVSKYYTSNDSAGAFGVDYNKTFRFELGSYLSARYGLTVSKHFSFRTRLDLYCNYLAKDTYLNGNLVKRDNPGNIDILWDNTLTLSFAKYFAVNIGLTAIYDNDIPYVKTYTDENGVVQAKDEPFSGLGWWQVKQVMTIGFNYKF